MAEQAAVYGGHDNDFIGEVADRYICQICTKVLREPHLAVCCGHHFCESCLNKWFNRQQNRQSCPHCRAEGDSFSHVIHKGLRSEINQLKIRCTHRREGCQWTGELGQLKKHLLSGRGCGFVMVECPKRCHYGRSITTVRRQDLDKHLTQYCYLRLYQCAFCGLRDTYEAITGCGAIMLDTSTVSLYDPYLGHQAKCPKAPLTCPNRCGSKDIKRKDMANHRSQCPQEPLECPFAEAGCKRDLCRHQLEDHMSSSQQLHLLIVLKECRETKTKLGEAESKITETKQELRETKQELRETKQELRETESKLSEALSRLSVAEQDCFAWSSKLAQEGDYIKIQMPNFTAYRRSGKVWHSPPFYYREGYKMCLAVYPNGVEKGAGTHVSVSLVLLSGRYDDSLLWPVQCKRSSFPYFPYPGFDIFYLSSCAPIQRANPNELKEIQRSDTFCPLNTDKLKLCNDCLNIKVSLNLISDSDFMVQLI